LKNKGFQRQLSGVSPLNRNPKVNNKKRFCSCYPDVHLDPGGLHLYLAGHLLYQVDLFYLTL
jgi:hypothetical protein